MKKNVEIIKQLERMINGKLKQLSLDDISSGANGYASDENGNIIGLNLYQSGITDISILGNLTGLTRLYLWENRISDISVLKNLTGLTTLNLGMNLIAEIPVLRHLTNLETLNLTANRIEDISILKNLEKLKVLELAENRISDITVLKHLKHLTVIDLTNNEISLLPPEVVDWDLKIKWEYDPFEGGIFLEGNPFETPPVEIVKKGKKAINAYFKSLQSEKQALNEVKVLLVGDGGAGKTSLVKQLLGYRFDKNESQTHGIHINHWEIKPDADTIKVHLWDFGGQEIMHATHQFFLSRRSLYVLVLDGRREEKTEYWLKHIESFGGSSPVLVVINKIDEHRGFDVNRKFLLEKYKNIRGFHRVSCATKEGIEEFARDLARELAKVEFIHTTWSRNWFGIKNQLENMSDNYISYEKYVEMCYRENIMDDESQDTLVEFLNDLGIVLHFNDPALKETNVINPGWVTEAVYKIITSKELANNKGVLSKSSLKHILDKTDYPQRKHDFITELMKKFELCFSLDEDKILIPDLLEVGEPEFEFNYDKSLKFVFQYDFLPRSIMHRLIVRMQKDIKNDLRWRTGVVLEDNTSESSAVIKVDEWGKKISLFVVGEQKRNYFHTIRKTLWEINDDFKKLDCTEKVPLPDNDNILVDYDELKERKKSKKEFIFIGRMRKNYRVKEILDGIDEGKSKSPYHAVEANNGFEWDVFISYASKDYPDVKDIVEGFRQNGIRCWWDDEQIEPGDIISKEIEYGIQKSRCIMPCISCHQLESSWCRAEYEAALEVIIGSKTKQKIVPLILGEVKHEKLPLLMRRYSYVRYSDPGGWEKMLKVLKIRK